MTDVYLTEKEASLRYKCSTFWFQRCRWAGNGPPFLKLEGKVLYILSETDEWFNSHRKTKNSD